MDSAPNTVPENPTDLSIEAALELEELKQGARSDFPALVSLFEFIQTPGPSFEGQSVSMLDDIRSYAIFRDSLPKRTGTANRTEFRNQVRRYISDLQKGAQDRDAAKIDEAKRFCLALNKFLVAKKMHDLYSRRERSGSRRIGYESVVYESIS